MKLVIHHRALELSAEERENLERRLHFALGRFAARVTGVTVRLTDVNGPRGGPDKRCCLAVRLKPAGAVIVEDVDADLTVLVDRAADRAGRAVARLLDKRRSARRPEGDGAA